MLAGNRELIDTCWNVNGEESRSGHHTGIELIDTCWNVNMDILRQLTAWQVN